MNYWRGGQFLAKHPGLGMLVSGFVTLLVFQYSINCGFILVLFTLIMAVAWIYKVMNSQHSLTRAAIMQVASLFSRSRTPGSATLPPSVEQPEQWTVPPQMQQATPPSMTMQPPTQTSRGRRPLYVPPPIDQDRQ